MQSASAKNLAEVLDTKRVRPNGNYRWFRNHRIINWGNNHIANWMTLPSMLAVLNKPQHVRIASDKVQTFHALRAASIPTPDWTTSQDEAKSWLSGAPKFEGLKHAVVCRTLTRANSGRGIVFAERPEELVPAPLYTRYTPKAAEYRIHVFRELGVIDMQQKRKDTSVSADNRNSYIRNHDAGWVFCRENVSPPPEVLSRSLEAIMALGLDFGAVDIGYHPDVGVAVYEVNTAPGLEGHTLTNYAQAFKQL